MQGTSLRIALIAYVVITFLAPQPSGAGRLQCEANVTAPPLSSITIDLHDVAGWTVDMWPVQR